MRVYAFRAGKWEGLRTDAMTREEAAEWALFSLDYVPGEVSALVETQLVLRGPNITHAYAHREKEDTSIVYFSRATDDEFRQLEKDTRATLKKRNAEIRKSIKEMLPWARQVVRWEDLTAKQQARFERANLSPDECWNWVPLGHLIRDKSPIPWDAPDPVAPYKAFYVSIKGPVPKGVYLRHKCDNRLCMNPNHLEPGTAADNVRDMMERGRHYRQVIARKRAKWREAYRRRKEGMQPRGRS